MAYTTPTTRSTGDLITAAEWNTDVVENIKFLANPPACRVYRSTAQSIANNSGAIVTFNSERYDTAGMHSTSANTSRITMSTAGLYLVTFNGQFAAGSDYITAWVGLFHNNNAYIAHQANYPEQGGNTVDVFLSVSTVFKFAAGDFVEAIVFQRNGAATARNLASTVSESPEFSATWIGRG